MTSNRSHHSDSPPPDSGDDGQRVSSPADTQPADLERTILVTGGGTGGHINPGLAVVTELRRLDPALQVVWVGTPDRLEARLVPAAGIAIEFIPMTFLKGKGLAGKAAALVRMPFALLKAAQFIGRYQPRLVLGVGGYVAGPVTLAAAIRGIPTAIMEQNARPGLTNRMLGPLVDRVFVSFDETRRWFSPDKVRLFGNPIRPGLLSPRPGEHRPPDESCHVLVIGGSQGAASLNRTLPRVLHQVRARGISLEVRHSAGSGRVEEVETSYGDLSWVQVFEYIDDMAGAYAWADFVICRAGASTVAEVTALGKPAMYVPFPLAADNHQEKNGTAVVAQNGGILVHDMELEEAPPVDRLATLLADREALVEMGQAAARLGRPEAAHQIAEEILGILEDS